MDLTFIICEFGQPNFLAHALDGIVRNCPTKPRVLVPFSDPAQFALTDTERWPIARDFFINPQTGEKEIRFTSIYDYIERCGDWARANNIEFFDLTDICKGWKLAIESTGQKYKGGHDCAIKNNWAARNHATSEIIVPNYDADFYPSPGYDVGLLNCIKKHWYKDSTWIATHVQPRVVENPENYAGIDASAFRIEAIEATRSFHCSHIAWPRRTSEIVARDEWEAFYYSQARDETIAERCGARSRCHWNPQALRTEDFLAVGGFPVELGMDPHFDDALGKLGYTKYSTCEAFTLHKAWIRGELLAEGGQ